MPWWPANLDVFTLVSGVTSLVGLGLTIWTLVTALRTRREVYRLRSRMTNRVQGDLLIDRLDKIGADIARQISASRTNKVREKCLLAANCLEELVRLCENEPDIASQCLQTAGTLKSAANADDQTRLLEQAEAAKAEMVAMVAKARIRRSANAMKGEP